MNTAVLQIQNLCKSYGDKQVVNNESFAVYAGDILGFIDPNSADKSTSINMITTLVTPDSGSILFHGKDIIKENKNYKHFLGVVPQDLAIYEDLSTYENVRFFCSLYGFRGSELKKRVKQSLEFIGLWERCNDIPAKFSGGMKRRLNIACAIAHTPELLIMDEPTVGIDPQSRNNILEVIKMLHANGTTIIYTSHYMEEIETLCNRIILIDNGIVLEDMEKQAYKDKFTDRNLSTLEDIFLHVTGTNLRDLEN